MAIEYPIGFEPLDQDISGSFACRQLFGRGIGRNCKERVGGRIADHLPARAEECIETTIGIQPLEHRLPRFRR